MTVTVKLDTSKLKKLQRDVPQRASRIVRKIAFDMTADMKNSMGASPSSPGEPPGIDTGTLFNSIEPRETGVGSWGIFGADYGLLLESGTHTKSGGVWVAARPFIRPAAERANGRLPDELKAVVDV